MHEDPRRLGISQNFTYVCFAHLFEIPELDVRKMMSAEDVLDYLDSHNEVERTMADICQVLFDSGRCFHIVRKLVDLIIKTERTKASHLVDNA